MRAAQRPAGVLAVLLLLLLAPLAGAEGGSGPDAFSKAMDALQRDRPEEAFALVGDGVKGGEAPSLFIAGFLQDIGAGVLISHEKAAPLLEQAAAKRYEAAVRYLAWKYTTGFGLKEPDPAKAADLLATMPGGFEPAPGIARWVAVKDGMCEPRLSMALYWMMDRAGDNSPVAEANLATAFLEGGWTTPDMSQHLYWLQKAADHKEPESMMRLALYIELGLLGNVEAGREIELIRAAADAGHAEAQFALAGRLRRGRGVNEDVAAAADWYRKAADQGNVEAMVELGDLLREGGPGLEPDLEASYGYSRRAADLGNAEAMADAANMLRQGRGTPADVAEAMRLFEKAAASGYAYAADMLGWMAMNGEGGGAPDFERARTWYEKAAAGGNEHAMRELGKIHGSGIGVAKDDAKSFEWYERAAREGDAWSQNRVGWMLRQGIGIERDDEEAVTWFTLAAKNGTAIAHGNLAYHHANGLGVEKDLVEAVRHACLCLREESDLWTEAAFSAAISRATPEEQTAINAILESHLADPELMNAKGSLPEAILEILELRQTEYAIRDAEGGKKLLERMIAADRAASFGVIAWHYYLGVHVPQNITEARRYIRKAREAEDPEAPGIEAAIESICAESETDRERARQELQVAAEGGGRFAAMILAFRRWTGIGDSLNKESAERFYFLSIGIPEEEAATNRDKIQSVLGAKPEAEELPSEKFEELKARVPQKDDRHPVPVHMPPPTYPMELSAMGIKGFATVAFIVLEDGTAVDVWARESTHPLFAESAVAAVRKWKFAPGIKSGRPVSTKVVQTLRFNLEDDMPAAPGSLAKPTP